MDEEPYGSKLATNSLKQSLFQIIPILFLLESINMF